MNQFKYLSTKKELWLDEKEPEYFDNNGHGMSHGSAMRIYENRLHYSVSPELDGLLKDGQVYEKFKDFQIVCNNQKRGECSCKFECLNGIAIPLPEQTNKPQEDKPDRLFTLKEIEKAKEWWKTLDINTRQGIRWILGDEIGCMTDEKYAEAYSKAERQNF